ncbi:MAG: hypothetical protein FWC47_02240 [Oscillospiraceae bacterium]|nr:hypothetical protein [Oscillospiraceae bacterium]
MQDIKVIFSFEMENGMTSTVTVKDLRSDIDQADLIALGNKMIAKNGQKNGIKFLTLKKCERIVTDREVFDL